MDYQKKTCSVIKEALYMVIAGKGHYVLGTLIVAVSEELDTPKSVCVVPRI